MDYTEFCIDTNRFTSLTKQEIKNPFTVLKSIYKRNSNDLKKNLWDFFWAIHREQQWRTNEPGYYYNIYVSLIKLIDALWLINSCQPELSTKYPTPYYPDSKSMKTFNRVFEQIRKKHKTKEGKNHDTHLHKFYSSNYLSSIKSRLYTYIQVGLNASHMRKDKHSYYVINERNIVADFINLENLIEEGQNIYKKNKTTTQYSEYKKYIKFASNSDYPTTLALESITDPVEYIKFFHHCLLNFGQITKSLNIWKKSLGEKTFWLDADSPANVLFLNTCLKELIECTWLLIQRDQINMGKVKNPLTKSQKKLYTTLNEVEISQPFIVIENFFDCKKMHEWKTVLDSWVDTSFSYTKTIDMTKTSVDFHYLLRFIEATHLLVH